MELKPKYNIEFKTIKKGYNEQHLYVVDGKEYPSVSYLLNYLDDGKSGGLMGWAKKVVLDNLQQSLTKRKDQQLLLDDAFINQIIDEAKQEPEKIKQESADIGSQCHNAIDEYIYGRDYQSKLIDEKAKIAFENFLKWFSFNGYKFIIGDTPVVSVKYGYGGRLDALAKAGENIIIFDWKTSNAIRNSYLLQIAGYSIALQETYGIKPKFAYIVRFSKDTEQVNEIAVNIKKAEKTFKSFVKFINDFEKLKSLCIK